jgi:hypothetical protein
MIGSFALFSLYLKKEYTIIYLSSYQQCFLNIGIYIIVQVNPCSIYKRRPCKDTRSSLLSVAEKTAL